MMIRYKKLILGLFILIILPLFIISWKIYSLAHEPLLSLKESPRIMTIGKSTSAYQLVRWLNNQHLVRSNRLLLLLIRCEGWSQHIKAGVYQINPGETVMDLLRKIVAGDVITRKFTIIAGSTEKKVAQELERASYLEYYPTDWSTIIDNHQNAEGLLLADTYQYRGGSSAKSLLQQAHQHLISYLDEIWANKTPGLPYRNSYELLIAASIVEKETALPQERKLIAGVMVNRIKKGMPLQMDPTVIYAMGEQYKGKLVHNDLLIDSPYNSYQYRGLPPTPIAMVGKEALEAAAHPQLSNYLYFVAKGDGSHQFSETYQQQRQAIDHYQKKGY